MTDRDKLINDIANAVWRKFFWSLVIGLLIVGFIHWIENL